VVYATRLMHAVAFLMILMILQLKELKKFLTPERIISIEKTIFL